jgi:hypothetical protein
MNRAYVIDEDLAQARGGASGFADWSQNAGKVPISGIPYCGIVKEELHREGPGGDRRLGSGWEERRDSPQARLVSTLVLV